MNKKIYLLMFISCFIISLYNINAIEINSLSPEDNSNFTTNNISQLISITTNENTNCYINTIYSLNNSMNTFDGLIHTYNFTFGEQTEQTKAFNFTVVCESSTYNETTINNVNYSVLLNINPDLVCKNKCYDWSYITSGSYPSGDYQDLAWICKALYGSDWKRLSNTRYAKSGSMLRVNSDYSFEMWLPSSFGYVINSLTCYDDTTIINLNDSLSFTYNRENLDYGEEEETPLNIPTYNINSCKNDFVSYSNVQDWINNNNSLYDIVGYIWDLLAVNKVEKFYSINSYETFYNPIYERSDYNFRLIFDYDSDKTGGESYTKGIYYGDNNEMIIYLKTFEYYKDKFNYTRNQTIDNIIGTIKHEFAHYIDLKIYYSIILQGRDISVQLRDGNSVFSNLPDELNMTYDLNGNLNNTEFFINTINGDLDGNLIPRYLRGSIYFNLVFQIYENPNNWRNEIVARIFGLCSIFNSSSNNFELINGNSTYNFCNQWNFSEANKYVLQDNLIDLYRGYIFGRNLEEYMTKNHDLDCNEFLSQGGQVNYQSDYYKLENSFKKPRNYYSEKSVFGVISILFLIQTIIFIIVLSFISISLLIIYRKWFKKK